MGIIKNMGFLAEASLFPCQNTPWPLIIKAGGRAVQILLMNAATFSCLDILKMRAGISPWHARGLRALIKGAIAPAEQDLANGVLKFLIPVEKALFFFFVVDLGVDFFANWQSQIFLLGGCDQQPDECTYSGDNIIWFCGNPGAWSDVSYFATLNGNGCNHWLGHGFTVPGGYYWEAFFSVHAKPFFPDQPVGSISTRITVHSGETFHYPPQVTPAPWFGNDIQALYHREGHNKHSVPVAVTFEATADVIAQAIGGTCTVRTSAVPMHNESIFPANCFGKPIQLNPT